MREDVVRPSEDGQGNGGKGMIPLSFESKYDDYHNKIVFRTVDK
jgi:hypothetical protein